jgi:hypothetical protein
MHGGANVVAEEWPVRAQSQWHYLRRCDDAACTAFVREAVIRQLGQHPRRVFTRYALRLDLLAWLAQFDNEQERMLCFDYASDWDLFVDLVGDVPDG